MSQSFGKLRRKLRAEGFLVLCALGALGCFLQAQDSKSAPAKSVVTGRYEGSAKNAAGV